METIKITLLITLPYFVQTAMLLLLPIEVKTRARIELGSGLPC